MADFANSIGCYIMLWEENEVWSHVSQAQREYLRPEAEPEWAQTDAQHH